MQQSREKVNTHNAEKRREHNLNLALKLASVFAIHPCLDKAPLAKFHTQLDTEIDRKAAIEKLKLQHAKAQARLPENERKAFRMPFQIGSTKSADSIQRWSEEIPDFVPGLSGGAGNGLYVVDCDKAKKVGDVDGVEYFHKLATDNGFDLTTVPATQTQSGGRHYFFRNPRRLGCTAKGFSDKNIQIRADGGYVIAPGSIRKDGRTYTPINGHPDLLDAAAFPEINGLIDAPKWLIDAAFSSAITDHEYKAAPSNYDPEDPTIADRYLFELERRYPEVIHVGARHDTAREAAHLGFDCGLEEERIVEILREWFSTHCEDPLPDGQIEESVRNMRNSRQDAIGRDFIANWRREGFFGAVDDPDEVDFETAEAEAVKAPRKGYRSTSFAEFSSQKWVPTEYTVKDLLYARDLCCLYGPSFSGKSYFAIDFALHVATGQAWCGRTVKQGAVIYVAAESPETIKERMLAWAKVNHVTDIPVRVAENIAPIDARDSDTVARIVEDAKNFEEQSGLKVALICIDTVARSMIGRENEASEMKTFVNRLAAIRDRTGASVWCVHHSGKDLTRGPRGASTLVPDMDLTIEIVNPTKDNPKPFALVHKIRRGEGGLKFPMSFERVSLGVDEEDGSETMVSVVSCRTQEAENNAAMAIEAPSELEQLCLDAYDRLAADLPRGDGEMLNPAIEWSKVIGRVRADNPGEKAHNPGKIRDNLGLKGWIEIEGRAVRRTDFS